MFQWIKEAAAAAVRRRSLSRYDLDWPEFVPLPALAFTCFRFYRWFPEERF